MQALTAAVSPERPFEITGAGRKKYCPKLSFIHHRRNTNRGFLHHEDALQWEGNPSHTPMAAGRECAPLLTLRWHVSNSMAEGADVPVLAPGKLAGRPFKCH